MIWAPQSQINVIIAIPKCGILLCILGVPPASVQPIFMPLHRCAPAYMGVSFIVFIVLFVDV